jgi:CRISPR/Cas system-associated endonuclease Cas1
MADGRSIVWLNENGRFQARVEGEVGGNILLRQAQFRAADKPEIALQLNYSSVSHLSAQFKKITGLTPSFHKKLGQKRKANLEDI